VARAHLKYCATRCNLPVVIERRSIMPAGHAFRSSRCWKSVCPRVSFATGIAARE
jgi:hypothetical protein